MFFFSPMSGVGHQNFYHYEGVGHVFMRNRVFISSGPHSPLYFLTSPLLKFSYRLKNSEKNLYSYLKQRHSLISSNIIPLEQN